MTAPGAAALVGLQALLLLLLLRLVLQQLAAMAL
jgi:hypothetical protein